MLSETYALERMSVLAYSPAVPTLGENIRRLRLAAGFKTQRQLANAMGIESSQLVSDWERNRRQGLDMTSLFAFAKACRVTIDDVVAGLDESYDRMRAELSPPTVGPSGVTSPDRAAGVSSSSNASTGGADAGSETGVLRQYLGDLQTEYDDMFVQVEGAVAHFAELIRNKARLASPETARTGSAHRSDARELPKGKVTKGKGTR